MIDVSIVVGIDVGSPIDVVVVTNLFAKKPANLYIASSTLPSPSIQYKKGLDLMLTPIIISLLIILVFPNVTQH